MLIVIILRSRSSSHPPRVQMIPGLVLIIWVLIFISIIVSSVTSLHLTPARLDSRTPTVTECLLQSLSSSQLASFTFITSRSTEVNKELWIMILKTIKYLKEIIQNFLTYFLVSENYFIFSKLSKKIQWSVWLNFIFKV